MTVAPGEATPFAYVRLHAEAPLTPLAQSLTQIFTADPHQLQRLAAELAAGKIKLTQLTVTVDPYVGPAPSRLAIINDLAHAEHYGQLAKLELHRITEYHMAGRYKPLMHFLAQFPVEWRTLLLTSLGEDVFYLEFKVDGDGCVEEAISACVGSRYEYALRAFALTFSQTVEIAQWIRDHERELPHRATALGTEEWTRSPALITFFDNFPEAHRNLLVKKALPELRYISFELDAEDNLILVVDGLQ